VIEDGCWVHVSLSAHVALAVLEAGSASGEGEPGGDRNDMEGLVEPDGDDIGIGVSEAPVNLSPYSRSLNL
jgi:hypothetical protein